MTIQHLIKELDKLKIENSSSSNHEKDYSNQLKEIEKVLITYNEKKANTIQELIDENLKNNDFERLDFTIGILHSVCDFESEDERKIGKKLTEVVEKICTKIQLKNDTSLIWNFYTIFDTIYHNPGLVDKLESSESENMIEQINKIADIKYDKGSDFELVNRKIIGCLFYFNHSKELDKLKLKYQSHFDKEIQRDAQRLK